MKPWAARLAFARTGPAIIDLLAIAPVYLETLLAADFRILNFCCACCVSSNWRAYSPGMRSLVNVLEAERKALAASAVILLGLVLIAASAMHLVEHSAQPDKFGSIPDAMWWAVVTLTTVGYGDVVPITLAGRIVAGFTMVMGMMMLALPIGIVATAFAEEIHRREFVVTWSMVARVPLFSSLDASEIAEIMHYLRAQTVPANTIIVRRGEPAQSMYFITSGEVVIKHDSGDVLLGEGQFFGEIAVLRKTRRTATVRATQPTKLLLLDATDLHTIMERSPEVAAASARSSSSVASSTPAATSCPPRSARAARRPSTSERRAYGLIWRMAPRMIGGADCVRRCVQRWGAHHVQENSRARLRRRDRYRPASHRRRAGSRRA